MNLGRSHQIEIGRDETQWTRFRTAEIASPGAERDEGKDNERVPARTSIAGRKTESECVEKRSGLQTTLSGSRLKTMALSSDGSRTSE